MWQKRARSKALLAATAVAMATAALTANYVVVAAKPVKTTAGPPKLERKSPAHRAGYALLVGCTKYDHRPRIAPLIGPANDVELLRHVLEDSYGFDGKNIVTLSEAAALEKGK